MDNSEYERTAVGMVEAWQIYQSGAENEEVADDALANFIDIFEMLPSMERDGATPDELASNLRLLQFLNLGLQSGFSGSGHQIILDAFDRAMDGLQGILIARGAIHAGATRDNLTEPLF